MVRLAVACVYSWFGIATQFFRGGDWGGIHLIFQPEDYAMASTIQETHPQLFAYAVDMTKRVASLVQYRPEFKCKMQTDDLQQELMLHVLEHLDQFDPQRGDHDVFVNMLIRTCIAKMIRQANRLKSRPPKGVGLESIDDVIESADGTYEEMFRMLGIEDKDRRTLGESSDTLDLLDMADGVEHLIRTLPRGYRKIARKLMTCSRIEAARDLGISRRRMAVAVDVIREHFGQADWLGK